MEWNIGDKIRGWRKISLTALSQETERSDPTGNGNSPAQISRIEDGAVPDLAEVVILCRAMEKSVSDLLARMGATAGRTRVDYACIKSRRKRVRLHVKGSNHHKTLCHHKLDASLEEYIEAAGSQDEPKGYFYFAGTRDNRALSASVPQPTPTRTACLEDVPSTPAFRATGITEPFRTGGNLEVAQQMTNHESARTSGLCDRRNNEVSLDEVERILIC